MNQILEFAGAKTREEKEGPFDARAVCLANEW